jgi:hypothetical protein
MELYSRYLDKEQRLFIIVERSGKITDDWRVLPATVKLLNVNSENSKDITSEKFQKMLDNKILTQIKNH